MPSPADPTDVLSPRGDLTRRDWLRAVAAACAALAGVRAGGATALFAQQAGINVLRHGVRGDGASDDRAALEAVLRSAPRGATVLLPARTYAVSGPVRVARDDLVIEAAGARLVPARGGRTAYLEIGARDRLVSHVTVRGLTVDLANAAAVPFGVGAFVRGPLLLENVTVRSSPGEGIVVDGGGGLRGGVVLRRCAVHQSAMQGIHVRAGVPAGRVEDCTVDGSNASGEGGAGIVLRGASCVALRCSVSNARDNGIRMYGVGCRAEACRVRRFRVDGVRLMGDDQQAVDCHVSEHLGGSAGNGLRIRDVRNARVTRGTFEGCVTGIVVVNREGRDPVGAVITGATCRLNSVAGIAVRAGSGHSLQGNVVYNNGRYGILGAGNAANVQVRGNRCYDDRPRRRQRFGIYTEPTTRGWRVAENDSRSAAHAEAGIRLRGAGHVMGTNRAQ
ncbi:MAG TPA: right-handed parallel beta-helix repeat-containing protein [Longimicrobium sp.]|nr:right-handed parallel beta-helix repeat-containing protein [Longimicrobium sp.]